MRYNLPYLIWGYTHYAPYFNLHHSSLINLACNLALYGILVLNKIKYPLASGGLCPSDPLLQRYNTRSSSSLLDPPLILTPPSENPGSAPANACI